jgi:hypothetical protein
MHKIRAYPIPIAESFEQPVLARPHERGAEQAGTTKPRESRSAANATLRK